MTKHRTRSRVTWAALLAIGFAASSGCLATGSDADYLVEQADAARGGLLWDRFWAVPDVPEPIEPGTPAMPAEGMLPAQPGSTLPADNPLYVINPAGNLRRGSDTWRCAECHGWDYLGEAGEYGNNSHRTGFGGVWSARDDRVDDLFDQIADGGRGHAYAAVLADEDIADLVRFVREGQIARADYVGTDGVAHGFVAEGQTHFEVACVACHGEDGRKLNLAEGEVGERYLGDVALEEPGRFLHKLRMGQPDGSMPPASASRLRLADVADVLAYVQALGRVQERQGTP